MQKVLQDCAVDVDGALRRNAARVYRLVYARAHRKEDAEDLFQEVFVRYARSAPAFDSAEHEKAWFLRVSINCINSFYKKAEHRRAVSVEQVPEGEAAPQDDFELLLMALPEEYRVEVHLFYGERMSVREIAKTVGRSENAVRVRLTRARKMLRESLTGEEQA